MFGLCPHMCALLLISQILSAKRKQMASVRLNSRLFTSTNIFISQDIQGNPLGHAKLILCFTHPAGPFFKSQIKM